MFENFAALSQSNSMTSESVLRHLHHHAKEAAERGRGVIVEIGAYRGASTVALAMGIRDAGRGSVHSIDPHKNFEGMLGGKFSHDDHVVYEATLKQYGVESLVIHHCCESMACAANWVDTIDLLWIDGDHSYEGVANDLKLWVPFLADGGVLILDDHSPGSDVEAAVRDHLPFSRYLPIERIGNTLVLRKTLEPRKLILCGGMQSSGSTLVSWCFLQRADLDGVYDMDNALIHQDFSKVRTNTVWVKMTIGAFRLTELLKLYKAQGWDVYPLIVTRDINVILKSLHKKVYGSDCATGDEPPLYIRSMRYLEDLEQAMAKGWTVVNYEKLIKSPIEVLKDACESLGLIWDEGMQTWPKQELAIAYMSLGSPSFHSIRNQASGLLATISAYQRHQESLQECVVGSIAPVLQVLAWERGDLPQSDCGAPLTERPLLPGVSYQKSRRFLMEKELDRLKSERRRIYHHMIIGKILKLWKRFVNSSLPFSIDDK